MRVSTPEKEAAVKAIFADYVDPLLASLGFARQRRTYRRYNAAGDAVVVEFQNCSSTPETYGFHINLALVPSLWLRFRRRDSDDGVDSEPQAYEGLVKDRLRPTPAQEDDQGKPSWADSPGLAAWWPSTAPTYWIVDTVGSAAVRGQEIAERLPEAIDVYLRLLDRGLLLDRLRAGGEGLRLLAVPLIARAVLLTEEGMSEELQDVLRELAATVEPLPDVDAWVRREAELRTQGG